MFKQRVLKMCVLASVLLASSSAMAYEEDMHFQITYIVCRAAGLTESEALTVAAVDEGMDDSPKASAFFSVNEQWKWHALDNINSKESFGGMGVAGILKRKEMLFDTAMTRFDMKDKLFALGVFFHYQQDTWAHRHHYDGKPHSYDGWTTYFTIIGHALDEHYPDRPPFDPVAALLCVEDGLRYATRFVKTLPNHNVPAYFDNYKAIGQYALVDYTWNNERMFFHQLEGIGGGVSPQIFINGIVRAQIAVYRKEKVGLPAQFSGQEMPQLAGFDEMRTALNKYCEGMASFMKFKITVPTLAQKESQNFRSLTTADIENRLFHTQ